MIPRRLHRETISSIFRLLMLLLLMVVVDLVLSSSSLLLLVDEAMSDASAVERMALVVPEIVRLRVEDNDDEPATTLTAVLTTAAGAPP